MAPPHFWGSRIHRWYSALLLPRKPSVYVAGSAATVSAITDLHQIYHEMVQANGECMLAE